MCSMDETTVRLLPYEAPLPRGLPKIEDRDYKLTMNVVCGRQSPLDPFRPPPGSV